MHTTKDYRLQLRRAGLQGAAPIPSPTLVNHPPAARAPLLELAVWVPQSVIDDAPCCVLQMCKGHGGLFQCKKRDLKKSNITLTLA